MVLVWITLREVTLLFDLQVQYLPPAYKVRGKVIFSVCLSIHGAGGGGEEGVLQALVPGLLEGGTT